MTARALEPGAEVGPFRIARLLGEGGVGRVYAALDTDLGRHVALKALRPELGNDAGFVERFRGEAASLARLHHPNITTLYSLHRAGRDFYMVMELVRGYTLEEVLQRLGPLGGAALRAVAAQACAGLGYAHRMGVIHRDIKTANLMLTEGGQLKIMDFGIARVRGSQRMTRAGSIIGTLAYMPPEQIKGAENDERSDIYSLGCVLYELASGALPFHANTEYELIQAHVHAEPPPLPQTDRGIAGALRQALAKSPAERFADTGLFAEALGAAHLPRDAGDIAHDELLARLPPPADVAAPAAATVRFEMKGPDTPGPRSEKQRRRGLPLPVAILGTAVLVLALGFGYVMLRRPQEAPVPSEESPTVPEQAGPAPQATAAEVPPSPNIYAPPDAPSAANTAITGQPVPACPVADSGGGVVEGHVDTVAEDGWPQVNGAEMPLYGVQDLDPSSRERLSHWLSNKGDEIVCCSMPPDTHRCLTARTHQDVGLYLLINGLAHSSDAAPQSYREAEQAARANHRGLWR